MENFFKYTKKNTEISREPEGFPDLDKALDVAQKYVFQYAINPEDFMQKNGGRYDDKAVIADLKYVEDHKRMFEKGYRETGAPGLQAQWLALRKAARVLEAMVLFNSEQNDWLGENVGVIVPSEFDDIHGGVDGIVEFLKNGYYSHLALGIDITLRSEVSQKLLKIKKMITEGHLTHIRYFHSEQMHFWGEKKNIPRVIIGADKETVRELLTPWVGGRLGETKDHHMQIQMLEQMECQLRAFYLFAEKIGRDSLAKTIQQSVDTIEGVWKEKEKMYGHKMLSQMERKANEDSVHRSLKEEVSNIFGKS